MLLVAGCALPVEDAEGPALATPTTVTEGGRAIPAPVWRVGDAWVYGFPGQESKDAEDAPWRPRDPLTMRVVAVDEPCRPFRCYRVEGEQDATSQWREELYDMETLRPVVRAKSGDHEHWDGYDDRPELRFPMGPGDTWPFEYFTAANAASAATGTCEVAEGAPIGVAGVAHLDTLVVRCSGGGQSRDAYYSPQARNVVLVVYRADHSMRVERELLPPAPVEGSLLLPGLDDGRISPTHADAPSWGLGERWTHVVDDGSGQAHVIRQIVSEIRTGPDGAWYVVNVEGGRGDGTMVDTRHLSTMHPAAVAAFEQDGRALGPDPSIQLPLVVGESPMKPSDASPGFAASCTTLAVPALTVAGHDYANAIAVECLGGSPHAPTTRLYYSPEIRHILKEEWIDREGTRTVVAFVPDGEPIELGSEPAAVVEREEEGPGTDGAYDALRANAPLWHVGDSWDYATHVDNPYETSTQRHRVVATDVWCGGPSPCYEVELSGPEMSTYSELLDMSTLQPPYGGARLDELASETYFRFPLVVGDRWNGTTAYGDFACEIPPTTSLTIEGTTYENVFVMDCIHEGARYRTFYSPVVRNNIRYEVEHPGEELYVPLEYRS